VWDPGNEAINGEESEHYEYYSAPILLLRDIIVTCCNREDDVENSRSTDEGLSEVSRADEVQS